MQNKNRHIIIDRCVLQMLKIDSTNVQCSTIGNPCGLQHNNIVIIIYLIAKKYYFYLQQMQLLNKYINSLHST